MRPRSVVVVFLASAGGGLARPAAAAAASPRANEVLYELHPRQGGGGATTTITVSPATTFQTMDGFGVSLAFQRANLITNMADKTVQRQLLDLLFNRTTGAGFSILRNGIGSSPDSRADHMNTFAPTDPGGPTAPPAYAFDGKDSGQLFVSQEAYTRYGVRGIYGDAWSAPGYMKSNRNENNGGRLLASWRQAYADYLLAWVGFYRAAGVVVSHLGFLNEPEFAAGYASMAASGSEAAAMVQVLHAAIAAANLSDTLGVVCCDSEGWGNQVAMTQAIRAAGVRGPMLKAITSHTYTGGPAGSSTMGGADGTPVWLSEQCDLNGGWSTSWSSGSGNGGGGSGDGMTWAGNILNAVLNNNIGGYLYWEGVQWPSPNTNEKLIRVDNATSTFEVAKRLWAFAQFARYVRPGAVRVGAVATGGAGTGLRAAAFHNTDGAVAVVVLNTAAQARTVAVQIAGVAVPAPAAGRGNDTVGLWVTDNTHACEATTATVGADGAVSGTVPGRGMGTFVIRDVPKS